MPDHLTYAERILMLKRELMLSYSDLLSVYTQVKEKEKAMAEQLTFAEHVLLRAFCDKTLFLELDNLRY